MPPNEVEIVITDPVMASRMGVKPRKVNRSTAELYVQKGWAKFTQGIPPSYPTPSKEDMSQLSKYEAVPIPQNEEEIKKIRQDTTGPVDMVPGDEYIDKITWVTSQSIPSSYLDSAKKTGFKIYAALPHSFFVGTFLVSKLVVLSSYLNDFSDKQKRDIRYLLFQGGIPYIYKVEGPLNESDLRWIRQVLFKAKVVVFDEAVYQSGYEGIFGKMLKDSRIIKAPYAFWRLANDLLGKEKMK